MQAASDNYANPLKVAEILGVEAANVELSSRSHGPMLGLPQLSEELSKALRRDSLPKSVLKGNIHLIKYSGDKSVADPGFSAVGGNL